MLKYLIVQLDDTATSFCHYENNKTKNKLIPLEILREAILWSMKENLNVQFVYPDYELPREYKTMIDSVDHADILSPRCADEELRNNADVVVFDSLGDLSIFPLKSGPAYVLRSDIASFVDNVEGIKSILPKVDRLNVVFTDIEKFADEMISDYSTALDDIGDAVVGEYKKGHPVQINLLTDRMMLDKMNNCGAGDESITLAPDGKLYICPAFYLDGDGAVGNIESVISLPNQRLYRLDFAPICRICDAYQCKRCIWLNRKRTLEVNTPSREQCVMAHIERNASRKLLSKIREIGAFLPEVDITEINYLDPFEKLLTKGEI